MQLRQPESGIEDMSHFSPTSQDDDALSSRHTISNDLLDDVFGDEEPSSYTSGHHVPREPSDITRLRQEHTTSGYREGLAIARARSVQAGFDEGFGLGATIGLKAGQLLGILDGIVAAAQHGESATDDVAKTKKTLREARDELCAGRLFGGKYWNEDGTWKYDVDEGHGQDDTSDVLFEHIAAAHPLIKKWDGVVKEAMTAWNINQALPLLREADTADARGYNAEASEMTAKTIEVKGSGDDAMSW